MYLERNIFSEEPNNYLTIYSGLFFISKISPIEFARKKKPSGGKKERRKGTKLPNHERHDQNAAIFWRLMQRGEKKKKQKNKTQ